MVCEGSDDWLWQNWLILGSGLDGLKKRAGVGAAKPICTFFRLRLSSFGNCGKVLPSRQAVIVSKIFLRDTMTISYRESKNGN